MWTLPSCARRVIRARSLLAPESRWEYPARTSLVSLLHTGVVSRHARGTFKKAPEDKTLPCYISCAKQKDVNSHVVRWECIFLPDARVKNLDTSYNTLQHPIYHLYVLFCQNFIPSKILSSNIISCNLIYNASKMFFITDNPSAGNKQNAHIVNFSAGHMVTVRNNKYLYSILYVVALYIFIYSKIYLDV